MWQPLSLHFLLNSPRVCSLEPSMIMSVGTPSLLNNSDKPSCACDFSLQGNALVQPQG
jgi:hypothetical protein